MDKQIIYIAGAGRSGSTLLDICLGSLDHTFSLGESIFFVENGLLENEYCSCGSKVQDCSFWATVTDRWERKRILSLETYQKTQKDLLRNKNTLKNLYRNLFPTNVQHHYYNDLAKLYEIIFDVSKKGVVIDSSKSAQYILILKKLPIDLKIFHITRSFSGVLNSTKKEFKKNPAQGIERDMKPQSFFYTLSIWITDNILSWLFSRGVHYQRIKYENLVNKPTETLSEVIKFSDAELYLFERRGPLKAEHLVAGNKMRMEDKIYIQSSKPIKWEKAISKTEKRLAKLIDRFY